jgi:YidC/Oxa1 family membrane protein insertase
VIIGGVLSPIENVLTEVLIWLESTLGLTWAWAVVALTVLVRFLLVPVAIKQIHSMQSLQMHAPEMKAIQQRYKNDRQKQSEALMAFYKENKINPYASCLPLVFQIPIFIGLFFVLRDFEEEVFCTQDPEFCHEVDGKLVALPEYVSQLGWLDLVPDITAGITAHWSGYLLLVAYVVSQLTSTYLMSTQMQSTAQRMIILILPVVFIPFILDPPGSTVFPVGLLIYWLTTNLWSTGQGIITRRLMPRPVVPPKRTSRTPPKEAAVQEETPSDGAAAPSRTGPPRRVKRRKGGGGRRR